MNVHARSAERIARGTFRSANSRVALAAGDRMRRRHALVFAAALLVASLWLGATQARAQQKPLQEQLIGTWSFVASVDTRSSRLTERWGAEPRGILVFDR